MKWPWVGRGEGARLRAQLQDLQDNVARLAEDCAGRDGVQSERMAALEEGLAMCGQRLSDHSDALDRMRRTIDDVAEYFEQRDADREELSAVVAKLQRIELQSNADIEESRRATLALAERLEALRRDRRDMTDANASA